MRSSLTGWEVKVLDCELADEDLVAWYRNPTGGAEALRIAYKGAQHDQALYPDFVLFHQTDEGIRPSIVDPHGYHLVDAANKLKGLVDYAEQHSDVYNRIDAAAEVNHKLLALDLRSEVVRKAIGEVKDGQVKELFQKHGGSYS